MGDFYATYSASSPSSSTVTAEQGTVPWIVAGDGTAGTPSSGVVSVQGVAGGEPVNISGSITADNASVGLTGDPAPASATLIGGTEGGDLTALTLSGGALVVDGSGSTQPISGTVTADQGGSWTVAATQSGSWTVGQGTSPWIVDGSGSTQPISGTVTANQGGSWTVTANAGSGTFAVSGTVTANAGTGTFTTDQTAATNATFQDGSIAFGSLTTSYATVITAGGDLKTVILRNNTNGIVQISLDSGSTTGVTLDSGDTMTIDLKSAGRRIASATTIQAKYTGSAPTAGSIRVNGVY